MLLVLVVVHASPRSNTKASVIIWNGSRNQEGAHGFSSGHLLYTRYSKKPDTNHESLVSRRQTSLSTLGLFHVILMIIIEAQPTKG
jgi:hypothetical protein